VQCVAAEITVKVGVRLQQSYRDALARQEQRQHRAGWPTANDTATRLVDVANRMRLGRRVLMNRR
jgi:hypothetical protein